MSLIRNLVIWIEVSFPKTTAADWRAPKLSGRSAVAAGQRILRQQCVPQKDIFPTERPKVKSQEETLLKTLCILEDMTSDCLLFGYPAIHLDTRCLFYRTIRHIKCPGPAKLEGPGYRTPHRSGCRACLVSRWLSVGEMHDIWIRDMKKKIGVNLAYLLSHGYRWWNTTWL